MREVRAQEQSGQISSICLSINSNPSLVDVRLFGYQSECLQLVPLLQLAQFPPHFVQEAGALEAAAVAVEADDDGAEAADQNCGPVHLELL